VVVDDDILVPGENRIEITVAQGMRVTAMGSEDHEVCHVDDAHSQARSYLAKQRSCCYNFECYFHTDTNEDTGYLKSVQAALLQIKYSHIWVHAFIDASKLPNGRSRDAVLADNKQNVRKQQEQSSHHVRFLRTQPDGRGLLATDHQVHVVFRPQAMSHRGQEAVCIRRQVHTRQSWLQIEYGTNEGRVLMRESIMLLTCPGRCLEIIHGTDVVSPISLMGLRLSHELCELTL
jgi:hypothetical protein